jgi:uncharacterized protein (DUF1778 family)
MVSVEHKGRGRINLRVDANQEARLRTAVEATGETLTSFMLSAAGQRANHVLENAGRIAIRSAAFKRFVARSRPRPLAPATGNARPSARIRDSRLNAKEQVQK